MRYMNFGYIFFVFYSLLDSGCFFYALCSFIGAYLRLNLRHIRIIIVSHDEFFFFPIEPLLFRHIVDDDNMSGQAFCAACP